ncbi:MAG: MobV family relaxase [Candidatus Coproplasma sp.]
MSYLVCHMEKYKRQEVSPVEEENERDETYQASNPQIDSTRTHLNYNIICPTKSYMAIINERLSELELKRKIRSDAILMNSFIITSDGEFFKGLTPWEQQEFFRDCAQFFSDKYGEENMISAVVHLDETTPHMHLNFIPINEGRLSSKSLFDRQKLAQLQTELHESIGRKWGLQRGKEGSQAKHLSTAEFKAKKIIEGAEQREREIDEQTEKKRAELDELTQTIQAVEDAKNKPIPKRRKAVEAEIESLRTQNAAYKEYIAIKNRDTDSLFAELQKAERKAKANDTAFGMVADMMSAYPKEFDKLLKKSREKKTPSFNVHSNTNGKGGK